MTCNPNPLINTKEVRKLNSEKKLTIKEQINLIKQIMSKREPIECELKKSINLIKKKNLAMCPRCKEKLKKLSSYPYCAGCNWDSLTSI